MKLRLPVTMGLTVLLVGCAAPIPPVATASPALPTRIPAVATSPVPLEVTVEPVTAPPLPVIVVTAEAVTAEPGVISVGTAQVATAGPGILVTAGPAGGTLPPIPTAVPATPIPPLPAGGSPTPLKYALLAHYPDMFYCDPDYYPVARADETQRAIEVFPQLQANAEEFQAILSHNGLSGATAFSDAQKLLIYRDHKKLAAILFELAGDGYHFDLRVADSSKQGFAIQGVIDASGAITEQSRQPTFATCPICLAAHTRIDTPGGPVAVEDLHTGDIVWTVDAAGRRVAARLVKTARVFAPEGHQLVHMVLSDGRSLWASPGHPTADGRRLGDLQPGDILDGARVVLAERVRYDQPATYDVLPAGSTGFYWADGILIGSTLADR